MSEYRQKPTIDRTDVVAYLARAFARAVHKAIDANAFTSKAVRTVDARGRVTTTPLYDHQVNFSYLLDNIKRGPAYIAPKYIQEANELIAAIEGN